MLIRDARETDAPQLARVLKDADSSFDLSLRESIANWRETLRAEHAGPPRPHFTMVAELVGGEVVGLAMAGPARAGSKDFEAEFYSVYVRPAHQRLGLGRALMRAEAASLYEAGYSSAVVRTPAGNRQARRFYESLGGEIAFSEPPDTVVYGWPDVTTLH